jgi:hypothetical protein
MKFYKFLESKHLSNLLGGSILLGSLARYRGEEREQIRDGIEGVQEYYQSDALHYDGIKSADQPVRDQLAALGIPARGTNQVVAINNRMIQESSPCHLFCFSGGELESLKSHWERSYDCCVEITDPVGLAQQLGTRAQLTSPAIRNANEILRPLGVCPVVYDGGAIDVVQHLKPPEPSIFRKPPEFSADCEWRIAFADREALPKNLLLQLDCAAQYFRPIYAA